MSGVFGIFNQDGAPVTEDEIRDMASLLTRRGPDGTGLWNAGCAGLGHTLLATTPELLLPAIGAALHLLDFKRVLELLARLVPAPSEPQPAGAASSSSDEAQRIARLVSIAANHGPYRATCLRQSLALWWVLRRRGIAAELRIGVRKDGGELQSHAWVEHAGQALNDLQRATGAYAAFGPLFPPPTVSQR